MFIFADSTAFYFLVLLRGGKDMSQMWSWRWRLNCLQRSNAVSIHFPKTSQKHPAATPNMYPCKNPYCTSMKLWSFSVTWILSTSCRTGTSNFQWHSYRYAMPLPRSSSIRSHWRSCLGHLNNLNMFCWRMTWQNNIQFDNQSDGMRHNYRYNMMELRVRIFNVYSSTLTQTEDLSWKTRSFGRPEEWQIDVQHIYCHDLAI